MITRSITSAEGVLVDLAGTVLELVDVAWTDAALLQEVNHEQWVSLRTLLSELTSEVTW